MKILSIGNSFSEDAQRYIHQIAKSNGDDIYCANLYIGGCSLERHYNNIVNDVADYDWQVNGEHTDEKISIKSALMRDNWDYITVQQVSSYSGMIETYYPFISEILKYVKSICKNVKILLHQTWSYEQNSHHPDFKNYDYDTDKMFKQIVETNKEVAKRENIKIIIPDGEIINKLRKTKLFDYKNGGASLCRDTFHMDFIFGRYALGLTWYKVLTGKSVLDIPYTPPFDNKDTEFFDKINLIKNTVENFKF
ncbi:MAG: DUF4886 domain-containing protein [Acutalibacteraceae bacterium]